VFEAMLYPLDLDKDGKVAYGLGDAVIEVALPEQSGETFAALLKCIYSDTTEVNAENFKPLVEVADKFQIEKLAMLCADFLANDVNLENACELLTLTTSMHADAGAIRDFFNENCEAIFEADAHLTLPLNVMKSLLADDQLGIDEYPLFEAVVRWGNAEAKRQKLEGDDALKTVLKELAPLIRFPLLSIQELVGSVTKSGLLDQSQLLMLCSYSGITDPTIRKSLNIPFSHKEREGGFMSKESKLLDRKYKKELSRLFDNKKIKLKLLFRASRDGYNATAFHSACDNKGATLTVIKSGSGQYIFGGYNPESWHTSGSYVSSGCWLFSLDNPSHTPLKMTQSNSNGAYCGSGYGPTFGGGHDLHINSSMQSTSNYSSPSSFTSMASGYSGYFSNSTLAGGYNFVVEELEVFTVVKKD